MSDKNRIKKLAELSFNKESSLDSKRVNKISKNLNKGELREYIRSLKAMEEKKTIYLYLPNEDVENLTDIIKGIEKVYPGKKIMVEYDPDLIAGIKIVNDDNVYELSIQNLLEETIGGITNNYD